MQEHLLSIEHLSISFDKKRTVKDVSLFLDPGQILAVVGESGCGKSVTAKSILRLLPSPPARYTAGSIRYRDTDLLQLSEKQLLAYRGNEIALISQDSLSGLNPTMTVGSQICEAITTHRKITAGQARQIAVRKLQEMQLPEPEKMLTRYPHTLSGGQRQRVMIAMALACDPRIILADEPTTALDPSVQLYILQILNQLKCERDMAVMLITHDLRVAAAVADRIAVMYAGRVLESGTVSQILQHPAHPYTWGLLSSLPDPQVPSKSTLHTIQGVPPEPDEGSEGCPFAPRCPYAMKVCVKAAPPELIAQDGHCCSCWLLDSRSPAVRIPEPVEMLKRGEYVAL